LYKEKYKAISKSIKESEVNIDKLIDETRKNLTGKDFES
jgi:uncharacterized protein Yka (UPF0111/DUF47 family)